MNLASCQRRAYLQVVFQYRLLHVETAAKFVTGRLDIKTRSLLIAHRTAEETLAVGNINRKIVVGIIGVVAEDFAIPVGACAIVLAAARRTEFVRRKNVWATFCKIDAIIAVIGHRNLTFCSRTFLGSNQDNAVGSASTINSCRSCVFKNGHRLDILWRDCTDVATGNTVDYNQRAIGCRKRCSSANLERRPRVRVGGRCGGNVQTGHFTGKHLHSIVHSSLLELGFVYLNNRTRKLFLAQRTVTDNNNLIENLVVLQKSNVDFSPSGYFNLLVYIADVAENKCCIRLNIR